MRRFGAMTLALAAALVLSACTGKTTGATNITDASATLHSSGHCDSGQVCKWYWEYWPAQSSRPAGTKTAVQGPVTGPADGVDLSAHITGLSPNTTYRWVFCASPNNGGVYGCAGPNGTFGSTSADPPPDYSTFTTAPVRTLAEAWDGGSWRIQQTPNPTASGQGSFLTGVSCASAMACIAVGYYTNNNNPPGLLAEHWDGTAWSIQSVPLPTGGTGGQLYRVSCTSATACTAVGYYNDGPYRSGTLKTLVERWDGTSWTVQASPDPSGAPDPILRTVSCASPTACIAVGDYFTTGTVAFAEGWDGKDWTLLPSPPGGGVFGGYSGLSCTSATACTAVGIVGSPSSGSHPNAVRWDGTTWTTQTVPTPSGTTYGSLNGVSCTSGTTCIAVGAYYSPSTSGTLAERWDGSSWTIQPIGANDGGLLGVSCTSAIACTAVGSHVAVGGTSTLAERWDGTSWTIQPTPNNEGLPSLVGVSCSSDTACTAVGDH